MSAFDFDVAEHEAVISRREHRSAPESPPIDPAAVFERNCRLAAYMIANSTVLIFCAGAGWSADSGLPTYSEVVDGAGRRTYRSLCTPQLIERDRTRFNGFWFDCANKYADAEPHNGYRIVARWIKQRFTRGRVQSVNTAAPTTAASAFDDYFILTSNVDAHFARVPVPSANVYEIHGNIRRWQCSRNCTLYTWTLPQHVRFIVDEQLRAHATADAPHFDSEESGDDDDDGNTIAVVRWTAEQGFARNDARCRCGAPARPNILMFDDEEYIHDDASEDRFNAFIESVDRLAAANADVKVCIIEAGCGTAVPTMRWRCQSIFSTLPKTQRFFIRINIDDATEAQSEAPTDQTVAIAARSLSAVEAIDAILERDHTEGCIDKDVSV